MVVKIVNEIKINYDQKLIEIISELNYQPKLLLHSCCGPCSSYVITYLKDYFDITILYYNPNIEPEEEYLKRKNEQKRLIKELNIPTLKFLDCDYENSEFRNISKGYEEELEGGKRCQRCFNLRLSYTANVAKLHNFEYFGTTLTVSPHKNATLINVIGNNLANLYNLKWLYSDFKKKDGYKKSITISKQYDLYRQNYCGCLFSKEISDKIINAKLKDTINNSNVKDS